MTYALCTLFSWREEEEEEEEEEEVEAPIKLH